MYLCNVAGEWRADTMAVPAVTLLVMRTHGASMHDDASSMLLGVFAIYLTLLCIADPGHEDE